MKRFYLKYSFRNITRLPYTFLILFLSIVFLTFILINIVTLKECSNNIVKKNELPYKDYHLVVPADLEQEALENAYTTYNAYKIDLLVLEALSVVEEMVCILESPEKVSLKTFHISEDIASDMSELRFSDISREDSQIRVTRLQDSSVFQDFVTGTSVLVEGRHITKKDVIEKKALIIIDKALADINGLQIGDHIQIGEEENQNSYAEIIGFYKTIDYSLSKIKTDIDIPINKVYASTGTAISNMMGYYKLSGLLIKLTPGTDVYQFRQFLKDVYGQDITFIATDKYNSIREKGISTLSNITSVLLVLIILIIFITTGVMIYINIRSRIHEIGILRSLGLSKVWRIYIYEYIMIAIPAALLGTLIGVKFSKYLSVKIITKAQELLTPNRLLRTTDDIINHIDAVKDQAVMSLNSNFYAVTASICFLAILLFMFIVASLITRKVVKLSPLTILKGR